MKVDEIGGVFKYGLVINAPYLSVVEPSFDLHFLQKLSIFRLLQDEILTALNFESVNAKFGSIKIF